MDLMDLMDGWMDDEMRYDDVFVFFGFGFSILDCLDKFFISVEGGGDFGILLKF